MKQAGGVSWSAPPEDLEIGYISSQNEARLCVSDVPSDLEIVVAPASGDAEVLHLSGEDASDTVTVAVTSGCSVEVYGTWVMGNMTYEMAFSRIVFRSE